jgi:hypothetical protein
MGNDTRARRPDGRVKYNMRQSAALEYGVAGAGPSVSVHGNGATPVAAGAGTRLSPSATRCATGARSPAIARTGSCYPTIICWNARSVRLPRGVMPYSSNTSSKPQKCYCPSTKRHHLAACPAHFLYVFIRTLYFRLSGIVGRPGTDIDTNVIDGSRRFAQRGYSRYRCPAAAARPGSAFGPRRAFRSSLMLNLRRLEAERHGRGLTAPFRTPSARHARGPGAPRAGGCPLREGHAAATLRR